MKRFFQAVFIVMIGGANFLPQASGVYDSEHKEGSAAKTDQAAEASVASDKDKKATVYDVEGKALISKKGSPAEKQLKVDDEIETGDSVYTKKGASISIAFDDEKLNTVKIPADGEAVFTSIEPTTIELKDGSIFNAFDGLAEGSTWKIVTPAAVAAVRGTQFEVEYSASSGEFSTATYDDTNESKSSAVEIQSPAGGESLRIVEGKEMSFKRGQPISQKLVKSLSPARIERSQKMRKEIIQQRKKPIERKNRKDQNMANGPGGPGGNKPNDSGENRQNNSSDGQAKHPLNAQSDKNKFKNGIKSELVEMPLKFNKQNEYGEKVILPNENRIKEQKLFPRSTAPIIKGIDRINPLHKVNGSTETIGDQKKAHSAPPQVARKPIKNVKRQ